MNANSVARRERFLAMASDLMRLTGTPEVIEGKDEPRLCLTLIVDGMHCEVFHFDGAHDVVLHCHFPLPAHGRQEAMRGALMFNQQLARANFGRFAMREGQGDIVFSSLASMDDNTPQKLLEALQSSARWTPPWANQH